MGFEPTPTEVDCDLNVYKQTHLSKYEIHSAMPSKYNTSPGFQKWDYTLEIELIVGILLKLCRTVTVKTSPQELTQLVGEVEKYQVLFDNF